MISEYLSISTFWTLILFLVILLVTRYIMRQSQLPPGPWGLPFLGYSLFLDSARRPQQIVELAKRYQTKVLSVNIVGTTVIFLNDFHLVKSLFQKRTDLADRMDLDVFGILDDDYRGIIGASGRLWKEQRRFALYMLRDFGMGKLTSESYIQDETNHVMKVFASHNGAPFNPLNPVNMAVSNIINSMVFGKRFEYENVKFRQALYDLNELFRQISSPSLFILFRTSWGRMLFSKRYKQLLGHYGRMTEFIMSEIKEHEKRYDGTVNDFIDGYLKEMENGDPDIFYKKNLLSVITDLFIAGSETTSTTLRWALLYLGLYPDVQEKVYQELTTVLDGRLPNMNDKRRTPYTEATLSEVQRMNTLLPFGVTHTCVQNDFDISGYTIPKGVPVLANLHQIHTDPGFWKHPDQFNPDNFLDDNGQVQNLDRLAPFSIGRRACAGESLARMELYIFFTSWIQRFRVELVTELPDARGDYERLSAQTFRDQNGREAGKKLILCFSIRREIQ